MSETLGTWLTLLQTQAVLVEALERDLEEQVGMSLGWFEVLMQLAGAPEGRMRMQDLARSVLLSKSGVTRLMDRLCDKGWTARAACESDRRVTYATITPAGRDALRAAIPVHNQALDAALGRHLGPRELRAFRSTLRKLLAANGYGDLPCPTEEELGAHAAG